MLYMLLAANNFTSDIDIIAHSTDVAPVKEALAKTFLAKAKEVGIAKAEEWANHPVDWLLAGQESYSADSEASITDNGASVMQGGDPVLLANFLYQLTTSFQTHYKGVFIMTYQELKKIFIAHEANKPSRHLTASSHSPRIASANPILRPNALMLSVRITRRSIRICPVTPSSATALMVPIWAFAWKRT